MKRLCLEVPIYNKLSYAEKFFFSSIHNLSPLKDIMDICLNYNGPLVEKDIPRFNAILEDLGFTYYWQYSNLQTTSRECIVSRLRTECHLLSPYHNDYDYLLMMDDDISFNEDYVRNIMASIVYMDENKEVGSVFCEDPLFSKGNSQLNCIYPYTSRFCTLFTGIGVIVRNIYTDAIYSPEFACLTGISEDAALGVCRLVDGFGISALISNNGNHYANNRKSGGSGFSYFGWNRNRINHGEFSFLYYIKNRYRIQLCPVDNVIELDFSRSYLDPVTGPVFDYNALGVDELKHRLMR